MDARSQSSEVSPRERVWAVAEFLFCRRCGVLVGATYTGAGAALGVVNSRCIDDGRVFGNTEQVSTARLAAPTKRDRWSRLWTPIGVG